MAAMTATAPWITPPSPPSPAAPPRSSVATPAPGRPTALTGSAAEHLVVLVAPANGRFAPALSEGAVAAGELVAHVAGGRGRREEVRSPVAATIRGLLTRPGQLVLRGQALAWAVVAEGAPA